MLNLIFESATAASFNLLLLFVLFGSICHCLELAKSPTILRRQGRQTLRGADWLPVPKAGPGCWDASSSVWFPAPPYETGSAHAKGITRPGSLGNAGGVRFSRIAGCRWSYANDSINQLISIYFLQRLKLWQKQAISSLTFFKGSNLSLTNYQKSQFSHQTFHLSSISTLV